MGISLTACQVKDTGASKAKSTPEKTRVSEEGEYGFLSEPELSPDDFLVYILAKADKDDSLQQVFVIRRIVRTGSIVKVDVRAVDNNFMPLNQNDCIVRFVASDTYHHKRSFQRKKGNKSIHIKFKEKNITSTITQFEYTTIDARGVAVTYKYKKPRRYNPDIVDISPDHIKKLKEGENCDEET